MAARPSFSNDSRIVKMPLPNSDLLLKDYLLDDLSSCSSNGFRSYPRRRQCCGTKVRYLIEIDLNRHIKLPPMQKQFLKSKSISKSKSKSAPMLYRASAAVVTVFKKFRFSGNISRKPNFAPTSKNPSRKISKRCFWKRSTEDQKKRELKSFDESIKRKDNILPPDSKVLAATMITTAEMKTSTSNSNCSTSSSSYFTAASISSTTGGSSKINAGEKSVKEIEQFAMEKMNTENRESAVTTGNAKKKLQGEEKDEFSPISVLDFSYDRGDENDQDEVTSPFKHSPLYSKGRKPKHFSEDKRTKILARLNPVRLEDRITLSESRLHGSVLGSPLQIQQGFAAEKKAIALLQLLKATMPSHYLSESTMTKNVLLGFFKERFIEGNTSNHIILQEAKDWVIGQTKEMFESENNKLTYVKEMEKGVKWLKYEEEETRDILLELEYEVFTSLVEEILVDFHFVVF